MSRVGVALIGCGAISLQNHLPALALLREARLAALCDLDPAVLEAAGRSTGAAALSQDYREVVARDDVDAVIIATPNVAHAPIAIAAAEAGKHVFCEKPLAMSYEEALAMYRAAERAGVRHMTAFTYRFVPAVRYMAALVAEGSLGTPYSFRSCRLQDWGERALGWRQVSSLSGSGELGDMLSHRIDYAHLMVGPVARLVAGTKRVHETRGGQPSDLEDWVAVLADFEGGATGVLESSKVASGRGEGARSQDSMEVNGSEGSLLYALERPFELEVGERGGSMTRVPVPPAYLTWPGSPRDPHAGDPHVGFRLDQTAEFVRAILEGRPCRPSFLEGVRVQAVMDAALRSAAERAWVEVASPEGAVA